MISPTLVFLITNNVTSSFCSFDIIDLMTKGGPKNSSNMMVYWIYENAFSYYRVGPGNGRRCGAAHAGGFHLGAGVHHFEPQGPLLISGG